jgi:broad specificity phosphatase PhoE
MKQLYFVRHGLSEMNLQERVAGSTDTPLAAEGRKQAKEAGKKAKELGIQSIAASPLSRALETAQIIAKEIGLPKDKLHINKLLLERDFGPFEGKKWSPDLNLDGLSDIETFDTLINRAELALQWLNTLEKDNILVVSHGAFGRALRSLLLDDYPYDHPSRLTNAEIVCWYYAS